MWNGVSSSVTLIQADPSVLNNEDFLVTFENLDHGDGTPFDGRGNEVGNMLAHAFYPQDIDHELIGNVHLDSGDVWSLGGGGDSEYYSTITTLTTLQYQSLAYRACYIDRRIILIGVLY